MRETADNPAGFVTSEGAVGVELVAKYPFARDNVGARRLGNECPSVVLLESTELGVHGVGPVAVEQSGAKIARNGRGRRGDREIEDLAWTKDAGLRSGADRGGCRRWLRRARGRVARRGIAGWGRRRTSGGGGIWVSSGQVGMGGCVAMQRGGMVGQVWRGMRGVGAGTGAMQRGGWTGLGRSGRFGLVCMDTRSGAMQRRGRTGRGRNWRGARGDDAGKKRKVLMSVREVIRGRLGSVGSGEGEDVLVECDMARCVDAVGERV